MPSILSVHPIPTREATLDGRQIASNARQFLVLTDTRDFNEWDVLNAVGAEVIYASNPRIPGAEVTSLKAAQNTQEGHETSWVINVQWSTGGPGATGRNRQVPEDQRNENPTDRAAKIRARWELMEFATPVDLDGFLAQNSAGDTMDPGLVTHEQILVLTIQKNIVVRDFDIEDMNDSVNDFPITIPGYLPFFGRDEIWLTFEDAEKQRERQSEFLSLTAVMKCRRRFNVMVKSLDGSREEQREFGGWQSWPLNCGWRYGSFVNGVWKLVDFKSDSGPVSPKPKPLNASGGRLDATPTAVPLFGRYPPGPGQGGSYRVKKRRDFSTLGFF